MVFSNMRKAQQAVWEEIQDSLRIIRTRRRLNNENPNKLSPKARHVAARPWDRQVVDEAVWSVGRVGFLASPEQQAVVQAARHWYACGPDSTEAEQDAAEEALEDAVEVFEASLERDDEELSLSLVNV